MPAHRDAPASSSRETASGPLRKVVSGKHSFYTHSQLRHLQEDQDNKGVMRKTRWHSHTRAESFGELITANHKVLSEGCESRNNHRHAVVVQDLATQWMQSYPCKTKTSQETQRSLQKFLEPDRKPKVIYTENSLEFGKACEDLFWNHCTSTPHRSETNGIAERAVRRIKEGTCAVLLQSAPDEKLWADSMECHCYLPNFKISFLIGKHLTNGDSANHLKDQ